MTDKPDYSKLTGQELFEKIESGEFNIFSDLGGDSIIFDEFDSKPFKKALEAFKSEGNTSKTKEMEYEIKLFDFILHNPYWNQDYPFQRFVPMPNGSVYPDTTKILEDAHIYYKRRAKETNNIVLRARYCDFVWEYDKEYEYALLAVNSYIDLTKFYYKHKHYLGVADCLGRSLYISVQLQNGELIGKCIEENFHYLEEYAKNKEYRWLHEILESMVIFKNCNKYVQYKKIAYYFDLAIKECGYDVINKVRLIDMKMGLIKEYGCNELIAKAQDEIGKAYEIEADRQKHNPIVASDYFDKAIKHYMKINKIYGIDYTSKIDTLKIAIKQVNKESRNQMTEISSSMEIPKADIDNFVNHFKEYSVTECLKILASRMDMVMPYQMAIDMAQESLKDTPLLAIIEETVMSDDNIIGQVEGGEKKNERFAKEIIIHNCYSTLEIFIQPVIKMQIEEKKLDYNILFEFVSNSDIINKNRYAMIKLAFKRHFEEDFIDSIHLMIFQIEGILRDVLGGIGRPTTKITARNATHEKALDEVLRDEKLINNLTNDFCYFLRTMLSDPMGQNLRNRIAHGLAKEAEFHWAISMMLVMILMRFGILRYSNSETDIKDR